MSKASERKAALEAAEDARKSAEKMCDPFILAFGGYLRAKVTHLGQCLIELPEASAGVHFGAVEAIRLANWLLDTFAEPVAVAPQANSSAVSPAGAPQGEPK